MTATATASIPNTKPQLDKLDGGLPDSMNQPRPFDAASFAAADADQDLAGAGVPFTVLENFDGRLLTKGFSASADGKAIDILGAARNSSSARAIRAGLDPAREFTSLRDKVRSLKSNQCIITAPLPGSADTRQVLFKEQWEALPPGKRDLAGDGAVYRGRECFTYPAGQPALLELDEDTKDWPDAIQEKHRQAGGLFQAVLPAIDPQFKSAGYYAKPSSSAGVRNKTTLQMLPTGAKHLFFVVQDGADIPRYCEVLVKRLVLAGYGFTRIAKNGRCELRSLIDLAASGRPEWLWYDAEPILFDQHLELVVKYRQEQVREGPRLNTHQLKNLNDTEQAKYDRIVTELEAAAKPDADREREKYIAPRVERAVASGLPREEARRLAFAAIDGGRLDVNAEYCFDDDGWRSGGNLLQDADTFNRKKTGADPLEPDYHGGRNLAVWFRKPGEPGIACYSQAHGKRLFWLAYDVDDWIALVDQANGTLPQRLERLKDAGRHYLPTDAAQAHELLRQARVPAPAVLDFVDPEEVSRDALLKMLRDQDWDRLGRLRCLGRLRDEALADLRDEDEGLDLDFTVDWAALFAALTEADKAAAEIAAVAGWPGLPVIQTRKGQLHIAANEAEAALAARSSTRPVLQRGGDLVRPCSIPTKAADDEAVDAASLKLMTTPMLMDDLAHCAAFMRFDERKKKPVPIDPPKELAEKMLSRTGGYLPLLPRVLGVICAPTLRPDGSVLHEPGYDLATQRYHTPTSKVTLSPALMGKPTRDDALAAVKLLIDLLGEFPFASEVDRSVGLSLLVTPAVRTALRFSPMHLIRAALAGSGKSFLVNLAHVILSGRFCPASTAGETVKELEARIDAMLLRGHPMFSLDNLTGDLFSNKLCNALTEPVVSLRVLGKSKTVDVDNTYFIAATGNNVRPVGDLTRRVLTSDLDPQVERPELRQFRGDPVKAVMADRGKYLSACLIIPRAYMLAGMPGALPPLNGFIEWSNLVRSALVWLGQADPVDCLNAVFDDDPGKQDLRAVVEAWKTAVGLNEPVTVKELLNKADELDPVSGVALFPGFRDALAAAVAPATLGARTAGYWLRDAKGKIIDGVQIADGGLYEGSNRWLLRRIT